MGDLNGLCRTTGRDVGYKQTFFSELVDEIDRLQRQLCESGSSARVFAGIRRAHQPKEDAFKNALLCGRKTCEKVARLFCQSTFDLSHCVVAFIRQETTASIHPEFREHKLQKWQITRLIARSAEDPFNQTCFK